MSWKTDKFQCPNCGSRLFRGSRRGQQVYRCNGLQTTGCCYNRVAIGHTKEQVKRVAEEMGT